MPSDDSLFSRLCGARPGIAPKVIRAFPAARRQLRRRASALRGRTGGRNTSISGRREIQHVAPPEGARALVRSVLLSK